MFRRDERIWLAVLGLALWAAFPYQAEGKLYLRVCSEASEVVVGDSATLTLKAWLNDTVPAGNGIYAWDLGLGVSDTAVAEISSAAILAPAEVDPTFGSKVEIAGGHVERVYAYGVDALQSDIGIGVDSDVENMGNYTDLLSFEVTGKSVGEVRILPADLTGNGIVALTVDYNSYMYDVNPALSGVELMGYTLSVVNVPEPGSLTCLLMLSVVLRRRKCGGRLLR